MSGSITAERLREVLDCDPEAGIFTWKANRGKKIKAGASAGSSRPDGYVTIKIDGKSYLRHRLVWLYVYGVWPPGDLDHANGTPGDDRLSNLRAATRGQNSANRGLQANNTSGYKGVTYHRNRKRWQAQLQSIYLGFFSTPEEAHAAYCRAAAEVHGEFARFE